MNRIGILTKYFVKSSLEEMFSSKKKSKNFVMGLMMGALILCLSTPFAFVVDYCYDGLKPIGQEAMALSFILLINITISFFFGIYTIMNIFYFSNDIEYLLPMPFKSKDIVFAKFIAVMINMLIYSSMLILPLITYGVKSGAGINYYIFMIIVVLITPIMPMVIATFISILLMRFTNLSKHKDGFKLISSCISLIFIIGINLFNQSSGETESSFIISMLKDGEDSIIGKISGIFITNKFSTLALKYSESASGLFNIFIAIIISVAIYIIFHIIAGNLYLKSIIGISESYSKRENVLKGEKSNRLVKASSPIISLVKRDIKVVLRTPQFFMNSIGMLFYMPIILSIAIFSNGGSESISKIIESGKYDSTVLSVFFIIVAIFISSGGAALFAVSREGRDFIISKYIPINYKEHLHSKIISSICINSIVWLIILIILIILKVNLALLILASISSFLAICTITMLGLYFDYKSPKLDWEDEKNMIKNNFKALAIMFVMILIGAILVVLSLSIKEVIIMFFMIVFICALINYIVYTRLLILAEKLYSDIE